MDREEEKRRRQERLDRDRTKRGMADIIDFQSYKDKKASKPPPETSPSKTVGSS